MWLNSDVIPYSEPSPAYRETFREPHQPVSAVYSYPSTPSPTYTPPVELSTRYSSTISSQYSNTSPSPNQYTPPLTSSSYFSQSEYSPSNSSPYSDHQEFPSHARSTEVSEKSPTHVTDLDAYHQHSKLSEHSGYDLKSEHHPNAGYYAYNSLPSHFVPETDPASLDVKQEYLQPVPLPPQPNYSYSEVSYHTQAAT